MATTIKLKNSVTTTNAPSSLVQGEVAINVTDKKVWVGNAATTPVQLLGTGSDGNFSALTCTTLAASGVATFSAGTVSAPAITTTGDTNTGIFFPAADTIAFAEGGAESMRIDSSGNVGIGTSSPSNKLEVNGSVRASTGDFGNSSGDLYLATLNRAGQTSSPTIDCQSATKPLVITHDSALPIIFGTSNTERMRIDSSGNLLVGVTAPINASSAFGHFASVNGGKAGISVGQVAGSSASSQILFINSNGTVGSISTSGSSTSYNTSSDYRLKENIAPMTGALGVVSQLKPVTYNWKVDGSSGQGFIAHELQAVVPDCVTGDKDATRIEQYEITPAIPATYDEEGNELTPAVEAVMGEREVPSYQGIDTSFLVATLTKAIQELKEQVDAQALEIQALKGVA